MRKPTPPSYRTTNWRSYRAIAAPLVRAQWRGPLPDLLSQIPDDQPIGKVSAGGAYDTRGCHAAIAARCLRRHTCAQERAAMAGKHTRGTGQDRNPSRHPPPWPHDLATLERLSPPKPRRDMSRARKRSGGSFSRRMDAPFQTARRARHGARLRQAGGQTTDPSGDPEPFHSARHAANAARGMALSKGRGNSTSGRIVQQSPCRVKT